MEVSSAGVDTVPRAKRGPYKRYVYHNSQSQIPKKTKRYWKRKREASRKAKCLLKVKKLRRIEEHTSAAEDNSVAVTNEMDANHLHLSPISTHSDGANNENELDATGNAIFAEQFTLCEPTSSCDDESMDDNIEVPQRAENYSKDFLVKTLLVLATKLRHNLTYEAALDIVKLCTMGDQGFPKGTKYYWKKIINDFSTSMTVHFHCVCGSYVGVRSDQIVRCPICDEVVDASSRTNDVFLYMSLAHQLREILESSRLHDAFNEERHKQHDAAIEDIRDGKLYKKNNSDGMLSISFSVDGVPVFSSSNQSMYPLLYTINELEPRRRRKYLLLCSLWFGKGKPKINEYLKPFVKEAQELQSIGVDYIYRGTKYNKKFRTLVGITDSVARPSLRNSTQFNGEYGCGLCLHPGESIDKGKGKTRVYPPAADGNVFGEGLRTHVQTMYHIERREKGMKGRSILCDIPGFDIISSLDVDWMHAVALGVCRQFAKLWFDSTNNNEVFYFGHLIKEIDLLLLSYKPTMEISRTPRMMSERTHWKAHEWVIFLIFYSLPTLLAFFPRKYINHWALLVDGVQILCKTSIMRSEIVYAERSLLAFINGVEQLYGRKHMSFNVHLLAHLAQSVVNLGPLWAHSAFVYEDYNQVLLQYIKSSNGVTIQICDTFRISCVVDKLSFLCSNVMTNDQKNYLMELKNKVQPTPTLVLPGVSFLGTMTTHKALPRRICLAFERANIFFDDMTIESYQRVILNGETIHSKSYKLVKKRNNYCVQLVNNEIFEIELFYALKAENGVSCYALGIYFGKSNMPLVNDRRLGHMTVLPKRLDDLAVISVAVIKEKVTMLYVKYLQVSLACVHPNHYELLT